MGLRELLARIAGAGRPARPSSLPRAARRAAGRRRHHETGEPIWTSEDRVHRPVSREVNDAGGLGMGYGMKRTIVEDDDR